MTHHDVDQEYQTRWKLITYVLQGPESIIFPTTHHGVSRSTKTLLDAHPTDILEPRANQISHNSPWRFLGIF